jgi:agmatine/peptidylarginine deiminase
VRQADGAESIDTFKGTLPRRAADRMAAFYVNFNSCNQVVIVPVFGDGHDRMALK